MKYTFLVILMLFFLDLSGQTLILSDPIQVADNEQYGKTRPRIAVNGTGQPVVMWGQNSTKKVFVTSLVGGTDQFGVPVEINPNGVQAFISNWAGPDMGASGDTVFVAYHSTPEDVGKSYVHKSVDGGLTFGDSVRVDNPSIDQSRLPTVAVTPEGNPVVGFMKFEGNWIDPQYSVANSVDGGQSFQADAVASEEAPGEVCDCCSAQVVASGDKQAVVFRNNDDNLRDSWVSISSDGGSSFPIVEDVDDNNWLINSCPASGPDGFFAGDSLYTTWMSEGTSNTRIFIASVSAIDGGIGHSGLVRNVPFDGTTENFTRIDGDGQNIGIVYQTWKQGETDSYLTVSQNGVTGFSDTLRLGAVQDGAQRYPDIAFHNGVFHIVFDDSEAGHLMYQQGFYGNVGLQEVEPLEFSATCIDNGSLIIKTPGSEIHLVTVTNSLGQVLVNTSTNKGGVVLGDLPTGLVWIQVRNELATAVESVYVR